MARAEVRHDTVVDLAGEEAFETPDDLASGPAISGASCNVVDCRLVEPYTDDDGSIEGGVGLSVATTIEPVPAGGHAGRGRDWTRAAELRESGFRANPVGVMAEEDEHLSRGAGADPEALTEGGRRVGRESVEVTVVHGDFLGEGDPAAGERSEGVFGGRGGRVEGTRSVSGAAREEGVVGEVLEGFSQHGGRGHDDLLQGDHRRGPRLHGGVPRDLELTHHLDGAVRSLGGRRRLARQHRPSGGLGIDGVELAGGAAQAPVGSIHFRNPMPRAADRPREASTIAAGAFDAERFDPSECGTPRDQGVIAA